MNRKILGIGLKRFGIVITGITMISSMLLIIQLFQSTKPVKEIDNSLNDYDHVFVTVVEVLECIDVHEEEELNGQKRNYYLYLVKLDATDNVVAYETRTSTKYTLQEKMPMTINGEVYRLKGEKLKKAESAIKKANGSYKLLPYQIGSYSNDLRVIVLIVFLLFGGITCFGIGRRLLSKT